MSIPWRLLLVLALGGAALAAPRAGGPCTYLTRRGTARITELRTVPEGVEAHFDFTPAARTAPRLDSDRDNWLVLPAGLPTLEWLKAHRIAPGRRLPATRSELRTGTCTPVLYGFPTLPGQARGR